ncbi:LPXTG cell wall anchor domain-containing protein [Bacillus sp. IITD106]|nr:LPXTG cell wall anchor domain-containing protein [Bacillus sp. IITD106]
MSAFTWIGLIAVLIGLIFVFLTKRIDKK